MSGWRPRRAALGAIPNSGYGWRVRARLRPVPAVLLVGSLCALVAACGPGADDEAPAPPLPSATGPDLAGADLWLSFDDHAVGSDDATRFSDATGGLSVGLLVVASGGGVEVVDGPPGRGSALEFPAVCDDTEACPRAMVEVPLAAELDPGARDFEFGATVWLAPDQTTAGSNVVQRSRFAAEGGQWKLQVDGAAGRPSCVVRGAEPGAEPLVVRSSVSVADSAWHRVVCRRDADGISIEVDGQVVREPGSTGAVTSDAPVRVGAPGVGAGDDQFHGRLDDVYLLVDAG